jgi:hypothetical protein
MTTRRRRTGREQGRLALGALGAGARPAPRRLKRAAESTLRQLRTAGAIDRVDAAVVAAYRDLAGRAEAELTDPDGSTFNAVYAVRAFLEVHDRLTRGLVPMTSELEGFLAGLTEPEVSK